jgi:hypothetical protein
LVIRDEQMDAFRRAEWQAFLQRIEADARAALAARGDPRASEPLGNAVEQALRLAQRHGFCVRPHLARFARFVLVAGAGWQSPTVREVLGDATLTEEAKLARLEASAER